MLEGDLRLGRPPKDDEPLMLELAQIKPRSLPAPKDFALTG
jgi:hypothetical protein